MYNKVVPSTFFTSKSMLKQSKMPKKQLVSTSFKSHTVMSERNPLSKRAQLQSLDASTAQEQLPMRGLPKISKPKEDMGRSNFVTIQVLAKGAGSNPRNAGKDIVSHLPKTSELPVLRQQRDRESLLARSEVLRREESPRVNISIGSSAAIAEQRGVIASMPNHEKSPVFMKLFDRFEKYRERHKNDFAEYYNFSRKIYKSQKMTKRVGSTAEERDSAVKYGNPY